MQKSGLITSIYDCAINDGKWDEAIESTVAYCGARGAILGAVQVSGSSDESDWYLANASDCWRKIPKEKQAYLQKRFLPYQEEHWQKLYKEKKLGSIFDNQGCTDPVTLSQREDYVFRREELGILRSIAFRLNDDLGWFDTFVMHFGMSHKTIPSAGQALIKEIVPHISKSVELARTFGQLRNRYNAVLAAIDHVSIGLCIVLPNKVVAVANQEASRIFDEIGVIRLNSEKRLVANNGRTNHQLNEAIDKANNMAQLNQFNYESVFRVEANDGRAVIVEATHLADSKGELGEPLNCALVSIVDLSNTKEIKVDRLAKVYGLTSAEKAVCALLVRGFSNSETAEQRNVSPETVKAQISSIYRKTVVRNRIELIRLILKTSPPIRMA